MATTSPVYHRAATEAPRRVDRLMLLASPAAAVALGCAAQWLDFRELRMALLLIGGLGTLGTSAAALHGRRGIAAALVAAGVGVATWGAAQALYALIHVALGERFDAPRFGPQPTQALALVAAHALFLGLPTGIVASALLHAGALRRRLGR